MPVAQLFRALRPPRVFVSYAAEERDVAGHLAVALRAEGYRVFVDRDGLAPGGAVQRVLRREVAACDLLVFLASPHSVAEGRYPRTELRFAERKWPAPAGRVLAVAAGAVALRDLPPYLRETVLLRPEGDLVAETLDAVEALARRLPGAPSPLRRRALAAATALLLTGAAAALAERAPFADALPPTLPAVVVTRPQPLDTLVVGRAEWRKAIEVISGTRQQVACP
ncbi:MAG TPA: toll/interleukin-1 receptor domain-containing protein [Longimicrobium sp.]|nr:toll/interleukin-1 receptor domain-containing protein [Longimicrobium sp.]